METPIITAVQQNAMNDNMITLHSFMRDSYIHAKKHLEDSVQFIKSEFSFIYDKTGNCMKSMALPVNNFLKDVTQIEADFKQEMYKEPGQFICLHGKMMQIEEVLCQPMEENY
jgi:hypothetical protein